MVYPQVKVKGNKENLYSIKKTAQSTFICKTAYKKQFSFTTSTTHTSPLVCVAHTEMAV